MEFIEWKFQTLLGIEKRYSYIDTLSFSRNILKYGNIIAIIGVFIHEKFLKPTMGFRYLMYSHSLVPVIDL